MSSPVQIKFMRHSNDDDVAERVQRPVPVTLRGILTENDFESFSDKVDLLLDKFHASASVLGGRFDRLLGATFLLGITFAIVIFSGPNSIPIFYLLQIIFFSMYLCAAFLVITACKQSRNKNALHDNIRKECEQLTNCSASATFKLVLKEVKKANEENSHWEISHIDVIISNTEQL